MIRNVVAGIAVVAGYISTSIFPAEAACNIPSWRFRWGPTPTAVVINITEGSACGSTISLSSAEKLSAVAIVAQGANGAVRTTGNRFEYRPKSGFKGSDSFAVELRGNDAWGQPVTNRLNVSVNVQ
jgi:hypothetical protein